MVPLQRFIRLGFMNEHIPEDWIDDLVEIVHGAGVEILRWYGIDAAVVLKEDRTPLTEADRGAHRHLVRELSRLAPSLPVLSEESSEAEISGRASWDRFWLVDPLDGTKEFLKRSGEFTVNVALVDRGEVRVGIVHLPASGKTYRAAASIGAQMADRGAEFQPIRTRVFPPANPVLVASKDHQGNEVVALARALGPGVEFARMGSSLKFCLVAEGRADLYLRDLPTMEWDTGAAQCIVQMAGGQVYVWPSLRSSPVTEDVSALLATVGAGEEGEGVTSLRYNKASLKNPSFLVVGDPTGGWRGPVGEVLNGSNVSTPNQ